MTLTQHPLSAAFPSMQTDEYQSLKESILEVGVLNPIALYEGMVIDGWHRYKAAKELEMDCPSVELDDVNPRDFVFAQNKSRRHITSAQLALATAAVYAWMPAHRPIKSAPGAELPKTSKDLAAIAGTGTRSIEQAKTVQAKGAEEVVEAVKSGKVGLRKASAIAQLPKDEQAAALQKPMAKPAKVASEEVYSKQDELEDKLIESTNINLELISEIDELKAQLAVKYLEGTEEQKAEAKTIIDGLRKEVKQLHIELEAITISRDTFQRTNSEMLRTLKSYERKLKQQNKTTVEEF